MDKKEFLKYAVHEVKTPISIIHGFSELINYGIIKEEELKEFSGKIHKEADRLVILVDDLSYYISISENLYEYQFQEVDLRIAMENVACDIKENVKSHVDIKISGNGTVKGDIKLLEMLIYHIMKNGIIYTQSEAIQLNCIVENKSENGNTVISIEDNGIGISEEERKSVFQCFYRINKEESRAKGGNGMGLAICEKIASVHNASISINSNMFNGTKVTVEFINGKNV